MRSRRGLEESEVGRRGGKRRREWTDMEEKNKNVRETKKNAKKRRQTDMSYFTNTTMQLDGFALKREPEPMHF